MHISFVRFYILSYFNNGICLMLVSNSLRFYATVYWIFTLFYYKIFYITYTLRCKYVYVHARDYICVFMCIHVCMCIWVFVWRYWYAHTCICVFVGECVFAIFICHFNPSSVFLCIIYITHCAITLLCNLMLYICDKSTPDLNEDDERGTIQI